MRWFLTLALLLTQAGLLEAQAPPLPPLPLEEQLAQCHWDVRQLRAGREQAERNVSVVGVQFDKTQQELAKMRQDLARAQAESQAKPADPVQEPVKEP